MFIVFALLLCRAVISLSYTELLMDISLSEGARLVHPWPLRAPKSKPPPFITWPTFPAGPCLLHLSWHSRSFRPFLFRFVYSEHGTAGEPGAVAGVSGCWRVEGGVASSAVAVFVPRRRVSLETRGVHKWALSGLYL